MSFSPVVTIIETGVANTASVISGFEKIGCKAELKNSPSAIASASYLVLPGVGAYSSGMEVLREMDLVSPLRERILSNRATLGVCLGLQLFCEGSEESPGTSGLSVVEGKCERFPSTVRVPQLGWNLVEPEGGHFIKPGYAYFANSFRLKKGPEGWESSWTEYDSPFVSAFEKGNILACQFHPELSGPWGLSILKRWVFGPEEE